MTAARSAKLSSVTLLLSVVTALAGCLVYGRYQWEASSTGEGYVVVVSIRTDVQKASKPGWEREFVGPSRNIVLDGLRAHGFRAADCELLGPLSMNQGGMLMVFFVAGDEDFVRRATSLGRASYHEMIDGAPIVARGSGVFPDAGSQ
jgi:hypothetical protein